MTPVPIQDHTRTFVSPTNFNEPCGDLQIADVMDGELNIMYSAWKPTEDEIKALICGGCVILGVVGNAHPIVRMHVGDPPES